MHHQRACRKEPARGSPLGRYAGRAPLTPGLKFEIRPIVRTAARCPAARRLRMKATLPGLAVSTDSTWQAEIDQPSQELGMRRMSDTPHLSDIPQRAVGTLRTVAIGLAFGCRDCIASGQ